VAPTANYASQKSVRATAARHAAELHESVAGTIERAILPWWDLGQFNDDEAEQKQEQSIEVAADALLKEGLSEQDLLRRIVAAHENLSAVNYEARPGLLLLLLTRKSPAFAKALMDACLQDDGNPLAPWAEGIFLGLVHVHPEGSKELLERAALEGGPRLKLAVASTYRNIAFESVGSETIFRHLALLLNDSDKSVQRSALQTIWLAKHLDARERAKLLLGFEPASPAPINEWLTAVAPRALYAHFLPAERQTLVAKLQRFARLDFHCFGVLSQLCVDVPGAVVDMLLARVRECATASNDFEPLDEYHGRDYFSELPASDRERGLLFLGELLGSENWRVRVEAQQLFAKLASGDEGARRRVRLSWATSADPELILRAAESFRFEPQQALFTEADTVIAIARAAAALGPDVLEKVTNELVVASLSGVRVSSRGEAAPLDVFIRDEARARANPAGSPEATVYGAIAQSAASSIEASLRRDAEDTLLP